MAAPLLDDPPVSSTAADAARAPRVLAATLPASSSRRRYLRYSRASSRSSGRHQEGRRDRSPATDDEAEPLVVGDPWPRSRASELLAVFTGRVAGGIVSFGDLVGAPVHSTLFSFSMIGLSDHLRDRPHVDPHGGGLVDPADLDA